MDFNLDNQDVGSRTLAALAKAGQSESIVLSCRGARFRERVVLEGVIFEAFDATDANWERGLELRHCEVSGTTRLNSCTAPEIKLIDTPFRSAVYARYLKVGGLTLDRVAVDGYAAFDHAVIKQLTVRIASFGAEAR